MESTSRQQCYDVPEEQCYTVPRQQCSTGKSSSL